jgi:hypothetical protein
VYGVLFKAARDNPHTELISHIQPRLEIVFPFIADNVSNPKIKERFKDQGNNSTIKPDIERLLVA